MTEVGDHPAVILKRLGIRDAHPAVAVAIVAVLQAAFIILLFRNYVLNPDAYHVPPTTFRLITAVSLLAVAIGAGIAVGRLYRTRRARRAFEKAAADPSFNDIRADLDELHRLAGIARPVTLKYHARASTALHVADEASGAAIVVGLNHRRLHREHRALSRAMLAHEISHIELGATRSEERLRRLFLIYLAVLGACAGYLFVCLAYLERIGVARARGSAFAALVPSLDGFVLSRLAGHGYLLAATTVTLFVLSYFFLVRRELSHDLRACQLTRSDALDRELFGIKCEDGDHLPWLNRQFRRTATFLGLHPTDCRRSAILRNSDFVLLDVTLYPAVMAAMFPALPLIIIGFRQQFGISRPMWNVVATAAIGILMFLTLRADTVRLGVLAVITGFPWKRLLAYALILSTLSQLTGVVLALISFTVSGRSAEWLSAQMTHQAWNIPRMALWFGATLLALAYLAAVRISAIGDRQRRALLLVPEELLTLILLLWVSVLISLRGLEFVVPVTMIICALILLLSVGTAGLGRCGGCRARRWGALYLRTECADCGFDAIPHIRAFLTSWSKAPVTNTEYVNTRVRA